MAYGITCSTKILALAIAPFLLILVRVLCEYVTLPGKILSGFFFQCKLYCPLRKMRYSYLPKGTGAHIQQHIYQKDLNFCLPLYYYAKVIVELEKHKQGIQLCCGAYNETM